MGLHGLTSVTLGVPDVETVAAYYEDFGLRRACGRPGRGLALATADGGQLFAVWDRFTEWAGRHAGPGARTARPLPS